MLYHVDLGKAIDLVSSDPILHGVRETQLEETQWPASVMTLFKGNPRGNLCQARGRSPLGCSVVWLLHLHRCSGSGVDTLLHKARDTK